MKGIDKRTHKDETVSYRARVRIKGHPVLIQSFASKTLAMKWKRDTESAVEQGKYAYAKPGSKYILAELIERYIERVLPSKPKNARNVRQHLIWWKRDELLSGQTSLCYHRSPLSCQLLSHLCNRSEGLGMDSGKSPHENLKAENFQWKNSISQRQ